MLITDRDIANAWDHVTGTFPFSGYITQGSRQEMQQVMRVLARHVAHLPERPRLLDIGSGPMDKTAALSRLGFECWAVDDLNDPWHRSGDNLDTIQEFATRAGIRLHVQEAQDQSLPYPNSFFDVVTMFAVIEHLHSSPRGLLATLVQHLRPGGLICITMPNSVNLRKRLSVLAGRTNYPPVAQFYDAPPPWRGHVREYTLKETVYIVRQAGMDVVEARTTEGLAYDKLSGVTLRTYLALTRLVPTLRSALCVVARKPGGPVATRSVK